jgi:hypothetical protein
MLAHEIDPFSLLFKLVPRGDGPKYTRILAEGVHIPSTARSLAHLLGLLHTDSFMHSYRKSHSLL